MAVHKLVIQVVDGVKQDWSSELSSNNAEQRKPNGKKSKLYRILNYNQSLKKRLQEPMSPTTFFAVQMGVNLAIQTTRQVFNYLHSDFGRRYGDSNYQAIVNRRIEVITDSIGLIGGAISGAGAGVAVGGPVGAAVGAVVGVASAGINLGFKYAERERSYQHEMFKDSIAQSYNRARAGDNALTGRLR